MAGPLKVWVWHQYVIKGVIIEDVWQTLEAQEPCPPFSFSMGSMGKQSIPRRTRSSIPGIYPNLNPFISSVTRTLEAQWNNGRRLQ